MISVNYSAPADLFPSRRYAKSLGRYRRFAKAADAVLYAIEDMPKEWLAGTYLEVDGIRFGGQAIRRLYDQPSFPSARRTIAA